MRILCLSCLCVLVAGCGLNDSVCAGCGDDPDFPQDLAAHFEELEELCAGTFTGHLEDRAGAVYCRYAWLDYVFDAQMDGEPSCVTAGEQADCSNAAWATIDLVGRLEVEDETYAVTGYAEASGQEDEVLLECDYFVVNPNPGEFPALEESGGGTGLGVEGLNWRHEDGQFPDWEYCAVVMEEHLPPG